LRLSIATSRWVSSSHSLRSISLIPLHKPDKPDAATRREGWSAVGL
jgi:hypothetical protein